MPDSRIGRVFSRLASVIRRAPDAASPSGRQFAIYPGVTGASVKPWVRALPGQDWLGEYTPPWVPFWILKLMREDPQLSLGMGAIKSVFFGIEYRFHKGDPAARAFLNRTIIDAPWFDRLKLLLLNALDFGFQTQEILWDEEDVIGLDPDGKGGAAPFTFKGANVVRGFVDLDPEEIGNIEIDEFRNMTGVALQAQLAPTSIPAEKLLHAVHQLEFSNWWGASLLKRAFLPWLWVNHLNKWHVRYMQGKADPPYVGTAPTRNLDDPNQSSSQVSQDPLLVLTAQMLALRGGGAAGLPWEPDEKGNNKWTIRVLEDTGRADQFVTSINHLQAMKLRAIYLPDRAATQDTATGSFAMADAHIELFLSILEGIKRHLVIDALNQLARKIVRANFGKSVSMPVCAASDLSRQKQALMAELVKLSLDVPITLDDGREYTPKQLINFVEAFRSLNVAALSPTEVAREAPPAPAPGKGPNPDEGGLAGSEAEMRARAAQLARGTIVLADAKDAPAPVVNVTVNNPEQPPAVVNLTVPERPVTVQNRNEVNVPERKVVVKAGDTHVAAPAVNVVVEASKRKAITFKTDQGGEITGAEVTAKE